MPSRRPAAKPAKKPKATASYKPHFIVGKIGGHFLNDMSEEGTALIVVWKVLSVLLACLAACLCSNTLCAAGERQDGPGGHHVRRRFDPRAV